MTILAKMDLYTVVSLENIELTLFQCLVIFHDPHHQVMRQRIEEYN